jgi:carboxymethylenebutenolidase
MSRTSFVIACLVAAAPLAAQAPQTTYAAAMRHEHAHDTSAPSAGALIAPRADVVTESVTYGTVDGKAIKGFLAKPAKGAKNAPAIILVHEWWGLNENIQNMAKRYAGEGYVVLAVDLFGKVATVPDSAMVLYQTAMKNVPAGEKNLAEAIKYLSAQGATKIGAVGYCFGGHWSLRTGLVGGKALQAVVMYYGAPITDPSQIAKLQAPVLGLYGGKDQGIPVDSVRAMEKVMKGAGKSVTIEVYPEASHAFANPTGQAYNATVAEDAFKKTIAFFKTNLK